MGIMDGNCFFDGSCHVINDWNEKTVQNVMMQQEEKKVIVIDAGHGGGHLRQNKK